MSGLSISKRFGEWGIKLKDRFGTISKIIVILLAVVLLCCGIMLVVDSEFNGTVGDWVKGNFISIHSFSDGVTETYLEVWNWSKLKSFLTCTAIGAAILWTLTAILFFVIGRRGNTKKVAKTTAKLIRDYFVLEEGEVRLPKEYEDISQYLSEIKKQNKDSQRLMLEEVNKKNDLIAYLAHDLKTPLTSVVGYLSLLEEAPDMPLEQKAKYIHIALDKALRLESLINEFFDITRYNLHEIVLEKEQIDLSYMLSQMADEFYPVLQARGNTIRVTADEMLTVYADPDKLARVFNNILKNAIAYSYANTPIEIKAGTADGSVWVAFANSGKTIPKRKLDTIFEKFYRLDDARSSNTGGAGLGLAIAKEIIAQHGGTITAVSQNQITTFIVTLPQN